MAGKNSRKHDLRPRSTTPLEWTAAVAGLLIVCGMVGYLTYYAVLHDAELPEITVTATAPARPLSGGFQIEFEAHNHTGATASQVHIEGGLETGGGGTERSEATLDYLPGHSRRSGGLFFRNDPGAGTLTLRATGYQKP